MSDEYKWKVFFVFFFKSVTIKITKMSRRHPDMNSEDHNIRVCLVARGYIYIKKEQNKTNTDRHTLRFKTKSAPPPFQFFPLFSRVCCNVLKYLLSLFSVSATYNYNIYTY